MKVLLVAVYTVACFLVVFFATRGVHTVWPPSPSSLSRLTVTHDGTTACSGIRSADQYSVKGEGFKAGDTYTVDTTTPRGDERGAVTADSGGRVSIEVNACVGPGSYMIVLSNSDHPRPRDNAAASWVQP
jgi:hypothetical protein